MDVNQRTGPNCCRELHTGFTLRRRSRSASGTCRTESCQADRIPWTIIRTTAVVWRSQFARCENTQLPTNRCGLRSTPRAPISRKLTRVSTIWKPREWPVQISDSAGEVFREVNREQNFRDRNSCHLASTPVDQREKMEPFSTPQCVGLVGSNRVSGRRLENRT